LLKLESLLTVVYAFSAKNYKIPSLSPISVLLTTLLNGKIGVPRIDQHHPAVRIVVQTPGPVQLVPCRSNRPWIPLVGNGGGFVSVAVYTYQIAFPELSVVTVSFHRVDYHVQTIISLPVIVPVGIRAQILLDTRFQRSDSADTQH